ncbi:hypothetical protein AMECASPLE_011940 [Ameca splendens]|uniref:Uncharacterized protein n=1 Tax=Ameca splendens TaxID=208324 RepID=A0ABV0XPU9_9TELE
MFVICHNKKQSFARINFENKSMDPKGIDKQIYPICLWKTGVVLVCFPLFAPSCIDPDAPRRAAVSFSLIQSAGPLALSYDAPITVACFHHFPAPSSSISGLQSECEEESRGILGNKNGLRTSRLSCRLKPVSDRRSSL